MKKVAIFILALMLVFPLVSAIEWDMKTEFNQGETLFAKLSGNFAKSIFPGNIKLYRGHVRVSLDPKVTKINDEYYIYAQLLDKPQNNYTLLIENAKYYKGTTIVEEDISQNFTIINTTTDFYVDPGFVVTEEDFSLEVQNLQDSKITIQITITTNTGDTDSLFSSSFGEFAEDAENSLILKSGETKKINFELGDINAATFKIIQLSTANTQYSIPLYIPGETSSEENKTGFNFEPSELNITLPTNDNKSRFIYLYNYGTESLKDINFSLSDSLKDNVILSASLVDEIEKDSSLKLKLYFYSEENKTITGQIKAKTSDGIYAYLAVDLEFIPDFIPLEEDEIYDAEEIDLIDDESSAGSSGKIIGWLLLIVIVVAVIWFFKKKYKGTKKGINLLKIAKGKK